MLKRILRRTLEAPRPLWRVACCCGIVALPLMAAAPLREAPNLTAIPINQLAVSGNACGPAALLNALRFGDANWQRAVTTLAGETDRDRLLTVIRTWGMRPSKSLTGRNRWSRHGVNVDDLCDIANELTQSQWLPRMKCEVLLALPGESSSKLLARVHHRLNASLKRELPPIISIRRIVKRAGAWEVLQGHYVTIIGLPTQLEKNATGFPVSYIDPWGGQRCAGRLVISSRAFVTDQAGTPTASPCLEADFPLAEVGKKLAKSKESTLLTLAAGIGKW